jgi:hypothetical protein
MTSRASCCGRSIAAIIYYLPRSVMSDASAFPYATHLNILFPALSLVDVPRLVSQVKDQHTRT